MEVRQIAAWVPAGLQLAIQGSMDAKGSLGQRDIREPLATDERLRRLYQRVAPLVADDVSAWLGFIDTCEQAVGAALDAPGVRQARKELRDQLEKIAHEADALADLLESTGETTLRAEVSPPLELFMTPELIETAGREDPEYSAGDGSEYVDKLKTLSHRASVPGPARLLRAISTTAQEAVENPSGVNLMREAAIASRETRYRLNAFTRAFVQRAPYVCGWKDIEFSPGELADLGAAVLNLPDLLSYKFTKQETRAHYKQAVRDALREGGVDKDDENEPSISPCSAASSLPKVAPTKGT
jgi:hypothetical protein